MSLNQDYLGFFLSSTNKQTIEMIIITKQTIQNAFSSIADKKANIGVNIIV